MIGEKLYCGLDVGSKQIKACLVKLKKGAASEVLGVTEVPTRGLKNAVVTDLGALAESIQQCLREIMFKASVRIKEVNLGVSGHMVEPRSSGAVIPLLERGYREINSRDIDRVNKDACVLGVGMEEEVLHYSPVCYKIDNQPHVVSPLNLHGHKLEAQLLLIVTRGNLLNNVVKAVHQAGFEVAGVHYVSCLAAEVILEEKRQKDGCVLLDVGASMTNVLFFKDGVLQKLDRIAVGGDDLTAAMVLNLNIPHDLAEDIKKSNASAILEEAMKMEEILIKRENSYVPIKRERIFEAMEPKLTEFLLGLENVFKSSGGLAELGDEIVMTGGAAQLSGLIERVEQKINRRVRLGVIQAVKTDMINHNVYAGAFGLAVVATRILPMATGNKEQNLSGWQALTNRVRELYYEYF